MEGAAGGHDARLLALLKSDHYDIVVLLERGGDDLCVLASEEQRASNCLALTDSHVRLASLARKHGATVLYLGTYQLAPAASKAIVDAERSLGVQMAARYVEVSERLRSLREAEPELPWLHADGGHPGISTTALMGVLVCKAISGTHPVPFELCTGAEMYTPKWKHDGLVRHADIVREVQSRRCLLNRSQMHAIAQAAATMRPMSHVEPES